MRSQRLVAARAKARPKVEDEHLVVATPIVQPKAEDLEVEIYEISSEEDEALGAVAPPIAPPKAEDLLKAEDLDDENNEYSSEDDEALVTVATPTAQIKADDIDDEEYEFPFEEDEALVAVATPIAQPKAEDLNYENNEYSSEDDEAFITPTTSSQSITLCCNAVTVGSPLMIPVALEFCRQNIVAMLMRHHRVVFKLENASSDWEFKNVSSMMMTIIEAIKRFLFKAKCWGNATTHKKNIRAKDIVYHIKRKSSLKPKLLFELSLNKQLELLLRVKRPSSLSKSEVLGK